MTVLPASGLLTEAIDGFIQVELGFVVLLSIAAFISILIRRIRIPYTVALVVAGLVLTLFPDPFHIPISISSSLILALLVPPLIFEATLQIRWETLRQDLVPILIMALLGTLFSMFIVAGIVEPLLRIPMSAALAFGALIAATDPVAVLAFFSRLGVSRRLSVLVEGESLFNDAAAIVLFNLVLVYGVGSGRTSATLLDAVREFVAVAGGGLIVGAAAGYFVSQIVLRRVDDHLVETAVTLALAFGSYVVAEHFGYSGILSVVVSGLLVGNLGFRNTSPTTKLSIDNFWQFLAFVVNSMVFLLIGLRIEIEKFQEYILPVVVAVLAILVSRAVVVYVLTWLHERLGASRPVPVSYRHVMFWGGLRGAISLALALTLTDAAVGGPGIAEELRIMTFGVVLFTLLVQGLSIEPIIRLLNLATRSEQLMEQQRRQARIYAVRAGRRELDRLSDDGILSPDVWRSMSEVYDDDMSTRNLALREHLDRYQELEQEMVLQAREDVLRAERTAIADAFRRGLISEAVHLELVRELDNQVAALDLMREARVAPRRSADLDADSGQLGADGGRTS